MPDETEVLLKEHSRTAEQIFHNVSETTSFINFTVLAIAGGAGLLATRPLAFALIPLILYAWVFRVVSLDHETVKLTAYKASLEKKINSSFDSPGPYYFERALGERDTPSLPTKLVAATTHGVGVLITSVSVWIVTDRFGGKAGLAYALAFLLLEGFLVWTLSGRDYQRMLWDQRIGLGTQPDAPKIRRRRITMTAWAVLMTMGFFLTPVIALSTRSAATSPSEVLAGLNPSLRRIQSTAGLDTPWVEIVVPNEQLDLASRTDDGVQETLSLLVEITDGHTTTTSTSPQPQAVVLGEDTVWVVSVSGPSGSPSVLTMSLAWKARDSERHISRSEIVTIP